MSAVQEGKVATRFLAADEFWRVAVIFEAHGSQPPDPATCRIVVAEDEQANIVGMFVLQIVFHGEPLWVADDYQRQGVAGDLIEAINQIGQPYFSFVTDERVAEICRRNGMQEMPYKVFYKARGE